MNASKIIVLINGEDKTDSVASYRYVQDKCEVVYENFARVYNYNSQNVRILQLKRTIDPKEVIFKYQGSVVDDKIGRAHV